MSTALHGPEQRRAALSAWLQQHPLTYAVTIALLALADFAFITYLVWLSFCFFLRICRNLP